MKCKKCGQLVWTNSGHTMEDHKKKCKGKPPSYFEAKRTVERKEIEEKYGQLIGVYGRQRKAKRRPKRVRYGACDNCVVVFKWNGMPGFRKGVICPVCGSPIEKASKMKRELYQERHIKTVRLNRMLQLTTISVKLEQNEDD